jgi:hypothetical protein
LARALEVPLFAASANITGTGLSSDFGVEFRSAARRLLSKHLRTKGYLPLFTVDRIRGILCIRNKNHLSGGFP